MTTNRVQYDFLSNPECRRLSHSEARELRRRGEYGALILSVLPLAFWMALSRSRMYGYRIDKEELVAVAFLCAVELVYAWKPRKQTWRRYTILQLRNAMWEYANQWRWRRNHVRHTGLSDEFIQNRRVADLGIGDGCLRDVEDVLFSVVPHDDALLFARFYGLCGYRRHQSPELSRLHGLHKNTIHNRLRGCMKRLHNHFCPDDPLTRRGLEERLMWRP